MGPFSSSVRSDPVPFGVRIQLSQSENHVDKEQILCVDAEKETL